MPPDSTRGHAAGLLSYILTARRFQTIRRCAVVCATVLMVVYVGSWNVLFSKVGEQNAESKQRFQAAFPAESHINLSSVKSVDEVVTQSDQTDHFGAAGVQNVAVQNYEGDDEAAAANRPRLGPPPSVPKDSKEGAALETQPDPGLRQGGDNKNDKNSKLKGESNQLADIHKSVVLMLNGSAEEHASSSTGAANEERPKSGVAWLDDTLNDTASYEQLQLCAKPSPLLKGRMSQAVLLIAGLKEATVVANHRDVSPGGHWRPTDCRARYRVGIIIPFRDRQSHLNRLLDYLIPMLQRQLLDFVFIVTEQYGHDLFNKGRIMNAAFTLADKLGCDCVIFHDVDMFPQDDRNDYGCPATPRHIGAYVNSLGYELWYDYLVGGVLSMTMTDYRLVNGYSNSYWAWGGEDDDMGKRILGLGLKIERPVKATGKFSMLKHIKRARTAVKNVYDLIASASKRGPTDGLAQESWRILKITKRPLYYHMYVDVGVPPDEWRASDKPK